MHDANRSKIERLLTTPATRSGTRSELAPAEKLSTSQRRRASKDSPQEVPPIVPDGAWLSLAASLGRRVVSARLAVTVVQNTRSSGRLPVVARYDGGQSALPTRTLVSLLRRMGSRPWYIGGLKNLQPLPKGRKGSAVWRQAVAAVKLPIEETLGYLMVFGEPGQSFQPVDVLRLEEVAKTIVAGLRHQEQALVSERRRIERLLHDTFAASLTGLLFTLSRLARADLKCPERELAERGSADVRSALRALRGILDSVAKGPAGGAISGRLADVLKDLVDDGVEVCTNVDADLASSLSAENLTCIYEVAREALVNVRRHSRASRVDLALKRDSQAVELLVADNGHGSFRAKHGSLWGGHGLKLMQDRVAELGGELFIQCCSGAGTQIVARLPVAE